MTATNHVITGSLIAAVVQQPALALPLAFVAHFVLDALPHFGNNGGSYVKNMQITKRVLPFDISLAFAALVIIAILQPPHWQIIALGGILCASPDLMWLPEFVRAMKGEKTRRPLNWIMKFHEAIQWGQRPWGIWLEFIWFFALGFALWSKI